MKRSVLTLFACLCLIAVSAWLIVAPAYAGSYTITCRNGTTRTCSGQSCTGSDAIPGGTNGWCQCTSLIPGTPAYVEDCDYPQGQAPREPPPRPY
jgi:hypothetical protein